MNIIIFQLINHQIAGIGKIITSKLNYKMIINLKKDIRVLIKSK